MRLRSAVSQVLTEARWFLLRWLTYYMAVMVSAAHCPEISVLCESTCPHCLATGLFQTWKPKRAWRKSQGPSAPYLRVMLLALPILIPCGRSHARAGIPRGQNYQGLSWKLAAQQPMQDTVFGKRAIWTQLKTKQNKKKKHDTTSEVSSHPQKCEHWRLGHITSNSWWY